jgi:hypothetical protein
MMNTGRLSRDAEVVVAPSALHITTVASGLRKDVGVAAQVRCCALQRTLLELVGNFFMHAYVVCLRALAVCSLCTAVDRG